MAVANRPVGILDTIPGVWPQMTNLAVAAVPRSLSSAGPSSYRAALAMPQLNGINALVQLMKDSPGVKVVFLTMHLEVACARRALGAGAAGFVLKHSASAGLIMAIRAALAGKTYITPALAGEVFQAMLHPPPPGGDPVMRLSPANVRSSSCWPKAAPPGKSLTSSPAPPTRSSSSNTS